MSPFRQRLSALLRELEGLDCLLADEVTANLSPESVRDALNGIQQIRERCRGIETSLRSAGLLLPLTMRRALYYVW
jgi:hypothetical protein